MIKGQIRRSKRAERFDVVRQVGEADFSSGSLETQVEMTSVWALKVPTPGSVIMLLPEGSRDQETYQLYSEEPLFDGRSDSQRRADVVTIGKTRFTVHQCAPWGIFFISTLVSINPKERA